MCVCMRARMCVCVRESERTLMQLYSTSEIVGNNFELSSLPRFDGIIDLSSFSSFCCLAIFRFSFYLSKFDYNEFLMEVLLSKRACAPFSLLYGRIKSHKDLVTLWMMVDNKQYLMKSIIMILVNM